MKKIEAILITAGLDRQGEMISPESLVSFVKQFDNMYIPIGIEHDPRIPPQGRFFSA